MKVWASPRAEPSRYEACFPPRLRGVLKKGGAGLVFYDGGVIDIGIAEEFVSQFHHAGVVLEGFLKDEPQRSRYFRKVALFFFATGKKRLREKTGGQSKQ